MNSVASELDLIELLVGHFDSGLILVRVQHGLDFEPVRVLVPPIRLMIVS